MMETQEVVMKGFNRLELCFKRIVVKELGVFLMSTDFFNYTVELYSWDVFFIEQYYDNIQGSITRITLACDKDMDKYMDDISLADLGLLTIL